jgi:hypothetical protein
MIGHQHFALSIDFVFVHAGDTVNEQTVAHATRMTREIFTRQRLKI